MTNVMTIDAARAAYNTAKGETNAYRAELRERREQEFFAAGGCQTCRGQGNVCVWGTLDSLMDSLSGCYDEFGACPDCDGKQVPWYGVNDRRRSQHPKVATSKIPPLAKPGSEARKLARLEKAQADASDTVEKVKSQWEIRKGSLVKVVRGRKTPKGTIGTVFWMGEGRSYGYYDSPKTRVGIKTADGVTHWVNDIDYCELLNPMTDADLDAERQKAKAASVARNLVSKGSEIVSERVSGKVAWAGYTKRGNGPWRALVKAGKDFWLEASEITEVNGQAVTA